jgi:Ulp1 family protease
MRRGSCRGKEYGTRDGKVDEEATMIDLTHDQHAIVDLTNEEDALSGEEAESVLVIVNGNNPFTERHRRILQQPDEWLTDEIINAYCARIAERHPDTHCCSSYFYTKISRSLDVAWLQRWRQRLGAKERIIVPINWGNSHWALIVFDVEESILRYYDSMMSESKSREALTTVREAFECCGFINSEEGNDAVGVLAFIMSKMTVSSPKSIQRIRLETPKGQPQQTDNSSCGVFICWWVTKLSGISVALPPNPISFRRTILETILGSGP